MRTPLKSIQIISAKIAHYEDRYKNEQGLSGKRRRWIHKQIVNKKRTLNHMCKLYIWGVGR